MLAVQGDCVSVSVQSLNCVRLFATPWTAACQASLSITNSRSLLSLMSIESVMPSSHLILSCPLLLLPLIFPSIRVFSNESVLCIRWPKYLSFSFSISPSNEYSGLFLYRNKVVFFFFLRKVQLIVKTQYKEMVSIRINVQCPRWPHPAFSIPSLCPKML